MDGRRKGAHQALTVVHSLHSSATSCNARQCPHLWATLLASAGSMKHEGALPFTEGCERAWTAKNLASSSAGKMSKGFRTRRSLDNSIQGSEREREREQRPPLFRGDTTSFVTSIPEKSLRQ